MRGCRVLSLEPTISKRERILLYGGAGVGKSNAVLATARRLPGSQFHIVDNDFSYGRSLETDYSDIENVTVYDVDSDEWEETLEYNQKAAESCGRQDFYVFDMSTSSWQAVQAWFTTKVYGVDDADYFTELRMNKTNKQPVQLVNDDRWTVIYKQYKKLRRCVLTCAGHVIWTAEASKLGDFDNKEQKTEYGDYLYKPRGQNSIPHLFHTVLYLQKNRVGKWSMTTVKDRGREEMTEVEVKDFSMDYLRRIAGWKPTKI